MVSLHIVAFIQIVFLPGFLICYGLGQQLIRKEITLLVSFGLSLLVNYTAVFFLVTIGVFTQVVYLGLVSLEIISLGVLVVYRRKKEKFAKYTSRRVDVLYIEKRNNSVIKFRGLELLYFTVTLTCLILISHEAFSNLGNIFQTWDAVISWNPWAVSLSNNSLPVGIGHYPLLIPANWSVSYVLTGTKLQFLPRAIMPIFVIVIVLTQIFLGYKKKNPAYYFTGILLCLTLTKFGWLDGLVDVPLAFSGWGVLLCLLLALESKSEKEFFVLLVLSGLFAIMASVIKQGGLLILFVLPVLVIVLRSKTTLHWVLSIKKWLLIYISGIILIVVPFYLVTEYRILTGVQGSELNYLINDPNLHQNHSIAERMIPAFTMFAEIFGGYFSFGIVGIGVIFSLLKSSVSRLFFVLLFIPSFLFWSMFLSYDQRNSVLSVVVFCLLSGFGFSDILDTIQKHKWYNSGLKHIRLKILFAVLVLGIVGASFVLNLRLTQEKLDAKQSDLELLLGYQGLNKLLFEYASTVKITGKILTDYQYLAFLPKLKEYYSLFYMSDPGAIQRLSDPAASYVLTTPFLKEDPASIAFFQFLDANIAKGIYKEILTFESGNYRLIKIRD